MPRDEEVDRLSPVLDSPKCHLGPMVDRYFQNSTWGGHAGRLSAFIQSFLYEPQLVQADGKGYESNLRFVPGMTFDSHYGPDPHCDVMVVGTIPSSSPMYTKEEDEDGILSVMTSPIKEALGNGYEVLTGAFEDAGIEKSLYRHFFLTHIVKFPRPTLVSKGAIQKKWIKESAFLLEQELLLVKPSYILCLGSEASKFFTSFPITDSQNNVFEYTLPDGDKVPVVCVLDPKAVIANFERQPQFAAGIQLFADLFLGRMKEEKQFNLRYVDTYSELADVVDALIADDVKEFAIDCEWGGNHWLDEDAALRTVQVGWSGTDAVVVVLRRCGMREAFDPSPLDAFELLGKLFRRSGVKIIGHNISADIPWLSDQGVDISGQLYFDTMLASHLFEPTASHVLEDLAVRFIPGWVRHDIELATYLKANPECKPKKKNPIGYALIPDDILHEYSAKDVCATFMLYKYYHRELRLPENAGLFRLYTELVMPATLSFIKIEMKGALMDPERLEALREQYHVMYEVILNRFRAVTGLQHFNPDSPQQKTKFLFETLGLTPIKTTGDYPKTWDEVAQDGEEHLHTPAADRETMEILGHLHPHADLLREVCLLNTVLNNFLPDKKPHPLTGEVWYQSGLLGHVKRDGRIHTRIGQMIKTGRLSSSNPNCQNMPNKAEDGIEDIFHKYKNEDIRLSGDFLKLRSAFVAPRGRLLICCDYKQAEIATLAYLSQDPTLIAAVQAGEDIHSVVCRQMFNLDCTLEEVKKNHKALRIAAKSIVFGLLYGRGATAIAREVEKAGVECSVDRAQEFMTAFMTRFPKVRELIDRTHKMVEEHGYVEGTWGRREYFYEIGVSDNSSILARQKRMAFNFLMQNYVGDLLRKALITLDEAKRRTKIDFDVVLTVYDSIMYEVPVADVPRMVDEIIPDCMTKNAFTLNNKFHIGIDVDAAKRWDEPSTLEELVEEGLDEEFAKRFAKSE